MREARNISRCVRACIFQRLDLTLGFDVCFAEISNAFCLRCGLNPQHNATAGRRSKSWSDRVISQILEGRLGELGNPRKTTVLPATTEGR